MTMLAPLRVRALSTSSRVLLASVSGPQEGPIKGSAMGLKIAGGSCCSKRMMATAQQSPPDLSKDLVVERLEGENAGIVVFGINRPKAMNALSKNLVTQMEAAVNAVKFDKTVRVLVLRYLLMAAGHIASAAIQVSCEWSFLCRSRFEGEGQDDT